MKRILFVLLMMTCSVAWAEWERIGKTRNYVSYVDKATIRKKDKFIQMWDMSNLFEASVSASGERYKSEKSLQRYDCKNETQGWVYLAHFSEEYGEGRVVGSAMQQNNEIRDLPIMPGSASELLWKIACGRE